MPNDHEVSASLAYRKNEQAILRGDVPEKYLRLLPYIPGDKILEIGSAEGVLALLLAKDGKQVTALERQAERFEAAQRLRDAWGMDSNGPRFLCGDIRNNFHRLNGFDTLVAVRMIYYLLGDLDRVFEEVGKRIPNVVLCGNKNRAMWWREGLPNRNDRADNYYASAEGMRDVLSRHGYEVVSELLDGDPIIVGRR
jgi:SAM-dependent methyltransferase